MLLIPLKLIVSLLFNLKIFVINIDYIIWLLFIKLCYIPFCRQQSSFLHCCELPPFHWLEVHYDILELLHLGW